jgi:hypothetical protein
MALIEQAAAEPRDSFSVHSRPEPDYDAEADRERLKLVGDQQLRRWSQLTPPRTLAEEILAGFRAGYWRGENSFDLASHGGYARTVTGRVAYLDDQAETFMVLTRDGEMARVPARDVVAARGTPQEEHRQLGDEADDEGLGVGRHQPSGQTPHAVHGR